MPHGHAAISGRPATLASGGPWTVFNLLAAHLVSATGHRAGLCRLRDSRGAACAQVLAHTLLAGALLGHLVPGGRCASATESVRDGSAGESPRTRSRECWGKDVSAKVTYGELTTGQPSFSFFSAPTQRRPPPAPDLSYRPARARRTPSSASTTSLATGRRPSRAPTFSPRRSRPSRA